MKQLFTNIFYGRKQQPEERPLSESEINRLSEVIKLWQSSGYDKLKKRMVQKGRNIRQRKNILKQLCRTQSHYLKTLTVIENDLFQQFKDSQLMTPDQEKVLFPDISSIRNLHLKLLQFANLSYQNWHPRLLQIMPVLLNLMPEFEAYSEYLTTHTKRQQYLYEIIQQQPEKVLKIFKSLRAKHQHLQTYLQKQKLLFVQQIFQIPVKHFQTSKLFFSSYASKLRTLKYQKYLNRHHPQFQTINDLIQAFKTVQQLIDQRKQQKENLQIIQNIKLFNPQKLKKNFLRQAYDRQQRIEEWASTQKKYINDLKLIVNQIQIPLNQAGLITPEEDRVIFSNIGAIIALSQEMYPTMKAFFDNWNPFKTQIAQAVIKLSNFFKIYIQYCNNYEKGKKILAKIPEENPALMSIKNSLKMGIDFQLIKPIQRSLKYKLLLSQYKKNLRRNHPDYNEITKAIQIFHQVAEKANLSTENENYTKKMMEMEFKFKNILQSSRRLKSQFKSWFEDEVDQCKVYVLTDLLLVINEKEQNNEKVVCRMFLDASSFVETCDDIEDDKVKYMLVTGRDLVGLFKFSTLKQRNTNFQSIQGIIAQIKRNQQRRRQAIQRAKNRLSKIAEFNENQNRESQNSSVEMVKDSIEALDQNANFKNQYSDSGTFTKEKFKYESILEQGQRFLGCFNVYSDFSKRQCLAYIFTDRLILNLQNRTENAVKQIQLLLDANSYLRVCEGSNKQKRTKLFIFGSNRIMRFDFYSLQKRTKFQRKINKAFEELKEKSIYRNYKSGIKKRPKITVLGVQNRMLYEFIIIKIQPIHSVMTQIVFIKLENIYKLEDQVRKLLSSKMQQETQNIETFPWNPLRPAMNQGDDDVNQKKLDIRDKERKRNKDKEKLLIKIQIFLNTIFCSGMEEYIPLLFEALQVFDTLKDSLIDHQNPTVFKFNPKPFKSHLIKIKPQNEVVPQSKQVIQQLKRVIDQTSPPLGSVKKFVIPKKIEIHLPSYKGVKAGTDSNKILQIEIFDQDTVGHVLGIVKKKLQLKSISDYGLLIMFKDSTTSQQFIMHLHEHQSMQNILHEHDITNESSKSKPSQGSFFTGMFHKLKHSFSQNPSKKSPQGEVILQLRKIYFFGAQIQSITWHNDPNRYELLCDQIFYLFKTRKITLSNAKSAELCGLYICLRYHDYLPRLMKHEVKINLFEEILPQNLKKSVSEPFSLSVWKTIESFLIKKTKDKQIFMNQLIGLVIDNQGLKTQFFVVENLGQPYFLDAKDKYLMLGVNWESLVVVRLNSLNLSLCSIKLHQLKISFEGYLISIEFEGSIYEFRCESLWTFRHILEMYVAYNRRYLKKELQFSHISQALTSLLR